MARYMFSHGKVNEAESNHVFDEWKYTKFKIAAATPEVHLSQLLGQTVS